MSYNLSHNYQLSYSHLNTKKNINSIHVKKSLISINENLYPNQFVTSNILYTQVVDNRRIITSFFWSIMNHY